MSDLEAATTDFLKRDVESHGIVIPEPRWSSMCSELSVVHYHRGECIFSQHIISQEWLFVTEGVTASKQTHRDGTLSIARFFERGQFCGNLTSTWHNDFDCDELVAISDTVGLSFPHAFFSREYLGGDDFGKYLRMKVVETLCFDKEILVRKTLSDTESRYRILTDHYETVIGAALQKDIAAFLGITPQGLSRFLRKRGAD